MSRRSRGHDYLGWALVTLVLLAPLPIGGIRGFFFMLYAVIVALMGIVYAIGLHRGEVRPRVPLSALPVSAVLFVLVILWLVVTMLPIGLLAAPEWVALSPAVEMTGSISIGPGVTFGTMVRYLTAALFFVLALQVAAERQRAQLLFRVLLWGIAAHALFALTALVNLGDVLVFLPKEAYVGDATGTFVNRNSFATFAAFGAIIGAALLFGDDDGMPARSAFSQTLVRAGLYLAPLAVIALALAYSHSRMGMFVAALGVGVVAAFSLFKTSGPRRLLAGGLIVAELVIGVVLANSGGVLFDRLGSVDRDADLRMTVYEQTLDLIAARPLTGYGAGTYEDAYKAIKGDPLSPDSTFDAAHDLYLELATDLGIPGAVAIVVIVLLPTLTCAAAAVRRRDNWAIPAAVVAVALAGAVHSLVDFSLQIPSIVLMYLFILAIGFAQSRQAKPSGE